MDGCHSTFHRPSQEPMGCSDQYTKRVVFFNVIVGICMIAAIVKMSLCRKPLYHFGSGVVMIGMGVLLWTVLYPKCPDDCDCDVFLSLFPIIGILIGLIWLWEGYSVSKEQAASSEDARINGVIPEEGTEVI